MTISSFSWSHRGRGTAGSDLQYHFAEDAGGAEQVYHPISLIQLDYLPEGRCGKCSPPMPCFRRGWEIWA